MPGAGPSIGIGSSGKRTPRSIVYGKWITRPRGRTIPMSTTWASKISWILSPTTSYIACMSSCSARPRWTSLMIASSAARSSVSVSSRLVSSNRRAFSRATLRLAAIVVSSSTSASLNAASRSRFWSEITPRGSSPTTSGTHTADFGSSVPVLDVPVECRAPRQMPLRSRSTRIGRSGLHGQPADAAGDRTRIVGIPHAPLDRVQEMDNVRRRVRRSRCRRPAHRTSPGSCRRRGRTWPASRVVRRDPAGPS